MQSNPRRSRDLVSIKRTIWSNYDRFRTLGVFYLERNEVFDRIASLPEEEIAKIARECREGGVRWRTFPKYLSKIESALLAGREVIDLSRSEERAFASVAGLPVAEFVRPVECPSGVKVSFAVNGSFDVLARGNRNGCFEAKGLTVTPETEFTLVNELLPFWEDRYSLALRSESLSFALSAEDPGTGKKGSACLRLYVIEDGAVRVDDLGKYLDSSALTLWINP